MLTAKSLLFKTLTALILGSLIFLSKETTKDKKSVSFDGLKKAIDQYLYCSTKDAALLTGNENNEMASNILFQFSCRLKSLMKEFKDTNITTRRIFNQYNSLNISIYWDRRSVVPEPLASMQVQGDKILNVILVPPIQALKYPSLHPSYFAFSKSMNSILIRALKWDDATLISRFYHELQHAIQQHVDGRKYSPNSMSDERLRDESEAYTLELEILDSATEGRVRQFFDSIIKGLDEKRIFNKKRDQAYASLTIESFSEFDELLGTAESPVQIRYIRVSELLILLGMHLVENEFPKDQHLEKKINQLRWYFNLKKSSFVSATDF